jgi:hypothetical protein
MQNIVESRTEFKFINLEKNEKTIKIFGNIKNQIFINEKNKLYIYHKNKVITIQLQFFIFVFHFLTL